MNYLQYMQRPAGPINNIPASLAAFQPEEEDMSPRKAFPNPKSDFERFVNTLPYNQQNLDGYRVKRYWELHGKPKNFEEAKEKGMYSLGDDGYYHASSIAEREDGVYEFMKPRTHSTIWMETMFHELDPNFKKEYSLQIGDDGHFQYVPR